MYQMRTLQRDSTQYSKSVVDSNESRKTCQGEPGQSMNFEPDWPEITSRICYLLITEAQAISIIIWESQKFCFLAWNIVYTVLQILFHTSLNTFPGDSSLSGVLQAGEQDMQLQRRQHGSPRSWTEAGVAGIFSPSTPLTFPFWPSHNFHNDSFPPKCYFLGGTNDGNFVHPNMSQAKQIP